MVYRPAVDKARRTISSGAYLVKKVGSRGRQSPYYNVKSFTKVAGRVYREVNMYNYISKMNGEAGAYERN